MIRLSSPFILGPVTRLLLVPILFLAFAPPADALSPQALTRAAPGQPCGRGSGPGPLGHLAGAGPDAAMLAFVGVDLRLRSPTHPRIPWRSVLRPRASLG